MSYFIALDHKFKPEFMLSLTGYGMTKSGEVRFDWSILGNMSTSIGNQAEDAAATYLEGRGYKVIDRNWRTRVCEIDIIAKKHSTIFFVEVKYRSSNKQGSGLDYITPKKLKQMSFAAEHWVQEHKYSGDFQLSAIEVSKDFTVAEHVIEI